MNMNIELLQTALNFGSEDIVIISSIIEKMGEVILAEKNVRDEGRVVGKEYLLKSENIVSILYDKDNGYTVSIVPIVSEPAVVAEMQPEDKVLVTVTMYRKDTGQWYDVFNMWVDDYINLPTKEEVEKECLRHYYSANFIFHVDNIDISRIYY